ncbi:MULTISPECIES: helix-turn-helix domain-containing protein [Geomicrobium]|uniref:Transcriptional regulator with XRE-family HTH domain n=1 Tax=Geomicrobium sediminis TaxID=1347788 RepID=A0ABS2PF20_9BACL|nr:MULTISPECIES: helix-turn-helix transcriptional regulator [Geomicrobium]MBM7634029.1 transcriptional regulator with XRE-family HTH domain [Geomicrobium sediminis]GAK01474.1 transcriptional regulator [Geomicrobium sp. JCM 19055]
MLSDKLSKLRTELKISQTELSKRLGIPRTTYSGYENGSREPDYETLLKIAKYFDVSTDYLLGKDTNKTPINDQEVKTYFYGGADDITPEEKEALDEVVEFELRRLRRAKERVEKAYEGDEEFKRSRNRLGED